MRTMHFLLPILIGMSLVTNIKAAEDDSTKVEKKIVKTIVINDDGTTTTDSTFVYDGDKVKVFVKTLSDSLSTDKKAHYAILKAFDGKSISWKDADELSYDVTVEADGDSSKVWVMKGPKGKMKEFHFKNDDLPMKHMMMFDDDEFREPFNIRKEILKHKTDMIDLNDPDIVSFERETLKNGNEKITIIRKGDK